MSDDYKRSIPETILSIAAAFENVDIEGLAVVPSQSDTPETDGDYTIVVHFFDVDSGASGGVFSTGIRMDMIRKVDEDDFLGGLFRMRQTAIAFRDADQGNKH